MYSKNMSTRISCATARLDDAASLAKFLAGIPNSEDLAKVLHLGEPVSSRAYDDETWTARFVASDGASVKCFAVTDITIDPAALDETGFRAAVAESLGPTFDPAD